MALSDCIKCWSTPCECGHEPLDNNPQVLKCRKKDIDDFVNFLEQNDIFIPNTLISFFKQKQFK